MTVSSFKYNHSSAPLVCREQRRWSGAGFESSLDSYDFSPKKVFYYLSFQLQAEPLALEISFCRIDLFQTRLQAFRDSDLTDQNESCLFVYYQFVKIGRLEIWGQIGNSLNYLVSFQFLHDMQFSKMESVVVGVPCPCPFGNFFDSKLKFLRKIHILQSVG